MSEKRNSAAAYLSGDGHRDNLAETGIVESEEAGDLATSDVDPALGHHTHTPLGIGRLKRVDVVHERRFLRDFKVADDRIALHQSQIKFVNFNF